jgi:hypothetical protein
MDSARVVAIIIFVVILAILIMRLRSKGKKSQ